MKTLAHCQGVNSEVSELRPPHPQAGQAAGPSSSASLISNFTAAGRCQVFDQVGAAAGAATHRGRQCDRDLCLQGPARHLSLPQHTPNTHTQGSPLARSCLTHAQSLLGVAGRSVCVERMQWQQALHKGRQQPRPKETQLHVASRPAPVGLNCGGPSLPQHT